MNIKSILLLSIIALFNSLGAEIIKEEFVSLTQGVDKSAGDVHCFIIKTPNATYYLDKVGGGLSSMLDSDNVDWIGFHNNSTPDTDPRGLGWQGIYRGFPNAVHRQNGSYFHAVNAKTEASTAEIEIETPKHVRIVFTSENKNWKGQWDFYPTRCDFTMKQVSPGYKYWILYEGLPYGEMNETDFWYSSADNDAHPIMEKRTGDLPEPEWMAFGDEKVHRVLYLLKHEDDSHPDDYFARPYMTVFGFGRSEKSKFIDKPQTFSIGFIEASSYSKIEEKLIEVGK